MAWVTQQVGDAAQIELPVGSLLVQNLVLMAVPIGLGLLVSVYRPQVAWRIHGVLRRLAMPALMLLATVFFVQHRVTIVQEFGALGLAMTVLIVVAASAGALLAWLTRLSVQERRTLVIEVGMQNAAQAITIACSPLVFDNEVIAIPAIVYALMMNVVLLLYVGGIKLMKG
jgi:BASS family bile acid:Na+ symporter